MSRFSTATKSLVFCQIRRPVFSPILPALAVFNTKLVLCILVAGVFSSAVAFLLMLALLKRWGATRMASLTYFTPVIAMLTDILFRARTPIARELIGLIFIFISLWLIQKQVQN